MIYETDNLKIIAEHEVIPPAELSARLPITEQASATVYFSRKAVQDIIHRRDRRLLVIVGPCSVHHVEAALEYSERLRACIDRYRDSLHIVMRVYFEKPRTTVGWKGLINDPGLDNSFEINRGLELARSLLLRLNEAGVSAGTEYLDPISPQYISDLVSWGAIGARTTESQVHRELASGLSCPVGFKNGTNGNLQIAVDALSSSSRPHHFLSLTKQGHSAIFSTSGNPDCHVIMRGGKEPNYDRDSVDAACGLLEKARLEPRVMIDLSHANSRKEFKRQLDVGGNVAGQIRAGDDRIIGIMVESNLVEGRQDLKPGVELIHGRSITDPCLGWEDTEALLEKFAEAVDEGVLSDGSRDAATKG